MGTGQEELQTYVADILPRMPVNTQNTSVSGTQQPAFHHSQDDRQLGTGVLPPETSAVIKLKGLPYAATEEQIREFFAGFKVLSIAFVYEPDGRPSGLAFAEFESKEEALKALSKNHEYIGERYVRLLHVPRSEMEEQVRLGTLAVPGAAEKYRNKMLRAQQRARARPGIPGVPVHFAPGLVQGGRGGPRPAQMVTVLPVGYQEPPPGYAAAGMQPVGAVWQVPYQPGATIQMQYHQAPPTADALAAQFQGLSVAPPTPSHRGPPPVQFQQGMQGQVVTQDFTPQQTRATVLGAVPTYQAVRPTAVHTQPLYQAAAPAAQILHTTAAHVQASSSPCVKIRGLPYRCAPAEILSFFQGYQYVPDSLQIGLDRLGRPSGEAWLTFISPTEALRAVRELNRRYLDNRYLELSIA